MRTVGRIRPVSLARGYFAVQAVAGSFWWIAVFASEGVRSATLGRWDPAILVVPDLLLFVGTSALAAALNNRVAAVTTAVWTTSVTIALGIHGLVTTEAGWGVVLMVVATIGSLAAAATIWFGYLPTRWFFVGPFAFRVADTATDSRHLRRSLAQLVVFWTAFFVLVPLVLRFAEDRLQLSWSALDRSSVRWAGGALFTLGSALGLWSCVTMALRGKGTPLPAETARQLVVAGPYRFVRNPMAVAGWAQTTGVGLMVGSWMVIAIALAGAVVWDLLIRPTEEADLADRFGEPYRSYAQQVRCWVPKGSRQAT